MTKSYKRPNLIQSFIPIIVLILLLVTNVLVFGSDSTSGPNQMALIFSGAVAAIIGIKLGYSWEELEQGIVHGISSSLQAVLILLIIGSLAGTWLLSGVVPAMIYYGLEILNPTIFLFATCIICMIVSLATGTSWGTIATVGVALLGVGKALGFSEGLIAGSIISGAYFGDKMSPMSDTTNLAPAMAGTDLFTHIRHMVYTTVPSISITLVIFLVLGFTHESVATSDNIASVMSTIDKNFNINLFLFIIPATVIFLIVKKQPALPALLVGTLMGLVFALIFQRDLINQISGITGDSAKSFFVASMKSLSTTISVNTGNPMVDDLLTTKGMFGMLNTIWLIMCAMIFGGIMEKSGLLQRITDEIIKLAHTTGSLIAATIGTCFFFNVTASDQYLAIVVPGRMYADTFRERGLKPENLSRCLEDCGTVTSVLIPWNTCGATQSSVLGVATFTYLPYCFFNIISPFMSIIFGYLNIKITRFDDKKEDVKKVEVAE